MKREPNYKSSWRSITLNTEQDVVRAYRSLVDARYNELQRIELRYNEEVVELAMKAEKIGANFGRVILQANIW
jgi:hypothetical protein